MNTKKGFTLIELLVVIAIIGILSSVVLASLNSARQKSRDARRVSDIKQLQLALELYFDTAGTYPAALSALVPAQIASIPQDPTLNTPYDYEQLSSGTSYVLRATLEQVDHTALDGDIDGTVAGATVVTNCGADPEVAGGIYYCVKP